MQTDHKNSQQLIFFHKQEMLNLNYGSPYHYHIDQAKLKQLLDLGGPYDTNESIFSNDNVKPLTYPNIIAEDLSKPFYTEQFMDINFLTHKIKELNETVNNHSNLSEKLKI